MNAILFLAACTETSQPAQEDDVLNSDSSALDASEEDETIQPPPHTACEGQASPPPSSYTFYDYFSGSSLSTSKWDKETGYSKGYSSLSNASSNISVSSSNLVLSVTKNNSSSSYGALVITDDDSLSSGTYWVKVNLSSLKRNTMFGFTWTNTSTDDEISLEVYYPKSGNAVFDGVVFDAGTRVDYARKESFSLASTMYLMFVWECETAAFYYSTSGSSWTAVGSPISTTSFSASSGNLYLTMWNPGINPTDTNFSLYTSSTASKVYVDRVLVQ